MPKSKISDASELYGYEADSGVLLDLTDRTKEHRRLRDPRARPAWAWIPTKLVSVALDGADGTNDTFAAVSDDAAERSGFVTSARHSHCFRAAPEQITLCCNLPAIALVTLSGLG